MTTGPAPRPIPEASDQSSPHVSIIIVTYQSQNDIGRCLESIARHAALPTETIVVDNGSTDGTLDIIQRAAPDTRVLALGRNLGFAAACNRGAEMASGAQLLFLNPDAELLSGTLPGLTSYVETHPRVAGVGPRLVYGDGRPQDNAFTYPTLLMTWLELFPRPGRLIHSRANGRLTSPNGQPIEIDHPLGACLLVRRAAWEGVGPFDEGFFLYCEEVDWCMRAKQRGWTIVQIPSVTAVHYEGRSSASAKAASLAHLYASRRRLHRKHRGLFFRAAASFITTFGLAHERARLIRRARGTATTDAATAERIAGIDRVLHRDP